MAAADWWRRLAGLGSRGSGYNSRRCRRRFGGAADFLNGVDEARLGKNIGRELQPGETALVIDESQKNMADFEALMKSVGETIMRHPSLGR